MGINVDNLDEYIDKVPAVLGKLEAEAAKAWLQEEVAEKALKTITSQVWLSHKSRLKDGKGFADKQVQHMTEVDPRVQAAHMKWARASYKRRHIEGQIRKWKSVDQKIPGLQGLQNQMRNSYNR